MTSNQKSNKSRLSSYKKPKQYGPISEEGDRDSSRYSRSPSPLKIDSQFRFFDPNRHMLTSPEEKKQLADNLIKKYMKFDTSSSKKQQF